MNSPVVDVGSVGDITRHITILREYIGMKPRLCVDAQQMHQFFGIARVFRKWFTESLAENGFASARDYTAYNKHQTGKGRPAVDYLVSLPMAMELASSLPHNLRAAQCLRYMKEIDASGKLPDKAGVRSVLDVIDKKLPPASAPAVVSLQASSIPVINGVIGGVDTLVVDARSLHEFLNVGRHFAAWIKGRILNTQYLEGVDYVVSDCPRVGNQNPSSGRGGDRKSINYLLSLNSAKELAMMERNAQGRAVRNYFIDCEKQLYTQLPPAAPEDPQKAAATPKTESGADTRVVAGDSIVMSPARFFGFKAVLEARQNRLALLSRQVYAVNLRATEDKAIAELTTAAFLKVATEKINKLCSESDLDLGLPGPLQTMIDSIHAWTHQSAV